MPLSDGRRLEVVTNGLPGFGGVQVAVNATLVSPVRRDGTNRPRADAEPGLALREATDHKRWSTYPEFRGAAWCRLVVVALEVGGRWGDETETFLRARPSPAPKTSAERVPPRTRAGGGSCWLSRRAANIGGSPSSAWLWRVCCNKPPGLFPSSRPCFVPGPWRTACLLTATPCGCARSLAVGFPRRARLVTVAGRYRLPSPCQVRTQQIASQPQQQLLPCNLQASSTPIYTPMADQPAERVAHDQSPPSGFRKPTILPKRTPAGTSALASRSAALSSKSALASSSTSTRRCSAVHPDGPAAAPLRPLRTLRRNLCELRAKGSCGWLGWKSSGSGTWRVGGRRSGSPGRPRPPATQVPLALLSGRRWLQRTPPSGRARPLFPRAAAHRRLLRWRVTGQARRCRPPPPRRHQVGRGTAPRRAALPACLADAVYVPGSQAMQSFRTFFIFLVNVCVLCVCQHVLRVSWGDRSASPP